MQAKDSQVETQKVGRQYYIDALRIFAVFISSLVPVLSGAAGFCKSTGVAPHLSRRNPRAFSLG
jgi:hypothetical protein